MITIITDVCTNCGDCINVCPSGAILNELDNPQKTGYFYIMEDICIVDKHIGTPPCIVSCNWEAIILKK